MWFEENKLLLYIFFCQVSLRVQADSEEWFAAIRGEFHWPEINNTWSLGTATISRTSSSHPDKTTTIVKNETAWVNVKYFEKRHNMKKRQQTNKRQTMNQTRAKMISLGKKLLLFKRERGRELLDLSLKCIDLDFYPVFFINTFLTNIVIRLEILINSKR